MSKEDTKLYLMGIFDGEGCICPSFRKDGYIALFVTVSMASEDVIDLFCATWGGSKGIREGQKKGYLRRYTWTMTGSTSIEFLQYVSEHSIVKVNQARYGLLLAQDLLRYRGNRIGINNHGGERLFTNEDYQYRKDLAIKIKSFNGARSRYELPLKEGGYPIA